MMCNRYTPGSAIRNLLILGTILLVVSCKQFEPVQLVIIETGIISELGPNSVTVHGEIFDIGAEGISQHGFVFAETPDASIDHGQINSLGRAPGPGTFSSHITGLRSNTDYYIRVYAISDNQNIYGNEKHFVTAESAALVTDHEGNEYATVRIGDQIWMAENLRTTTYPDGSVISLVEDPEDWAAMGAGHKAICYYNNDQGFAPEFGALYTWAAVMNGMESSDEVPSGVQGVCPAGWHVPSDTEWKILEMTLGMNETDANNVEYRGAEEGGKLKVEDPIWASPNAGASNESGFNALPSGYRHNSGEFRGITTSAGFWTSTELTDTDAWLRSLGYIHAGIYRGAHLKIGGDAVRCVKDD